MIFDHRSFGAQIVRSLFGTRGTHRRFTYRRARFFAVFTVLFVYGQVAGWIGLALDHLLYPRFRRIDLTGRTLFIVGNFRSGSTFLHRLLAADRSLFTAFPTWEIYLAPSIVQKQALRGLRIVDSWFGAPIFSRLAAWDRAFLQGVELHKISLWKPEEDAGILLYIWYSLFSWFFFPDWNTVEHLIRFDALVPAPRRRRVVRFYAGCLRRHLYFHGNDRVFVSKNPSFSPFIASFLEGIPGVRFIGLVRNPIDTVASTLEWLSFAWHFFADPIEPYPYREEVSSMAAAWFDSLRRAEALPGSTYRTIRFDDLVTDMPAVVSSIYEFLDRPMSAAHRAYLEAEASRAMSRTPDGRARLDRIGIDEQWLEDAFRATIEHYGFAGAETTDETGEV